MRVVRLILGNLLVFACVMLVAASGLELWARSQPHNSFLSFDPTLGYALRPGAEGVYRGLSMLSPNPEIRTEVTINSMGLRGPEREATPAPGRPRALIVGDSFVEAFEVPYEKTFYALGEERARRRGAPIELIPMGVMGYGQGQELLWLRERGVTLQPDLVVVVVFITNDISDNSYALAPTNVRPYFERVNGELELTHLPGAAGRLKYRAAAWLRSYRIYKELGARIGILRELASRFGITNLQERGKERDPGEWNARRQEAFELTFALLLEMREVAVGAGSDFGVAYLGDQETGSEATAEELFERFCLSSGLDCLNLNEGVEGSERYFVANDHHWNEAGHRVVAERMWDHWFERLASRGGAR